MKETENLIEKKLNKISDYLISIEKNFETNGFELKCGIYNDWIYESNSYIGCDVIKETDKGTILKIYPLKNNVTIDQLIEFVNVIVATNKRILEKEKEYTNKINEIKESFSKEIDELKKYSFNNFKENEKILKDSLNLTENTSNSESKKTTSNTVPKKRTRATKKSTSLNNNNN